MDTKNGSSRTIRNKYGAGDLTGLLIPLIVFFVPSYIVEFLFAFGWAFNHIDLFLDQEGNLLRDEMLVSMLEVLTQNAMLIQAIGTLIAIALMLRMFRKDIPKRRYWCDKTGIKAYYYILPVLVGITTGLAGNMYLNIGGFAAESEAFQESAQLLYSGSVIVQFLAIGIIIPIGEELLYRGLIYMRLRQYTQVNHAIMISALGFALLHQNLVQGIYAFVLGVILAYVYERYGTVIAPMLIHVSANLFSLVLSLLIPEDAQIGDFSLLIFGTGGAILDLLILYIIERKVRCRIIYAQSEEN